MAARRAATSVYATLGAAAATLVAVGGILAGPSILECSSDAGGLGTCLRGKLDAGGLLSRDVSSEPPAAGWMEAVANEYAPPPSDPATLAGTPADLQAQAADSAGRDAADVALAPAAELALLAPAQEETPVSAALVGPDGTISADLAIPDAAPAETAILSQPAGEDMVAVASPQPPADVAVVVEPMAPSDDLTGAIEPPPPEPVPVELSAQPEPPEPRPSSEPIVVEFNPSYPNVIVLPPPQKGDDSSFRSLQLN